MLGTPRTPPPRHNRALRSENRSPGTPRRRKVPHNLNTKSRDRTRALTPELSTARVKERLRSLLDLKFDPDDWQAEVVSRVSRGYDYIFAAGTGYGKSLVFQGLAKLGGEEKVVVVICPLKALEADQVRVISLLLLTGVYTGGRSAKPRLRGCVLF